MAPALSKFPIPKIPEDDRLVTYPIARPKIWEFYLKQRAALWFPRDVDLSKDLSDWGNRLTKDEKRFIKYIIAFFASIDELVNRNIAANFMEDVGYIPEIAYAYRFQMVMEQFHSEMYAQMLKVYIQDPRELAEILNAVVHFPCVAKKEQWLQKWMNQQDSFALRLLAFICVEGIFFSGAFCSIFWLKKRGLMIGGLAIANEYISRDEGLHYHFAIHLFSLLAEKPSREAVHAIFSEAVNCEIEFITEAIPCNLIGMNSSLMSQYVKYIADFTLGLLGYDLLYGVENPFDFMNYIGLQNKGNFFEVTVTDYAQRGGINGFVSEYKILDIDDI